jgi:hypothetical protein
MIERKVRDEVRRTVGGRKGEREGGREGGKEGGREGEGREGGSPIYLLRAFAHRRCLVPSFSKADLCKAIIKRSAKTIKREGGEGKEGRKEGGREGERKGGREGR